MTLAWLQWINPIWAWALPIAVVLPLLAHLRSRSSGRVVEFPAARFVQQAITDYHRWSRPYHWLLLLWRTVLLALVAATMMGPVWVQSEDEAAVTHGLEVVLILDRSASMTRAHRGATLWSDAKRQAIEAIRSLDPWRDKASVILLDARPESLLPRPSSNFSLLIDRVTRAEPTYERGDLDSAMRIALQHLSPTSSRQRVTVQKRGHIHLLSDMQATQSLDRWLEDSLGEFISLQLHPIGEARGNLAVSRPVVAPAAPIVGQPTTVSVDVANFDLASASHRNVEVILRYEDQTLKRRLLLRPEHNQTVSFTISPARSGPAWLEIELQLTGLSDALDFDNQAGLFFFVENTRPVALISDVDPDNPDTAAYFVSRALVPDGRETPGNDRADGTNRISAWESVSTGVRLTHESTSRLEERLITLERSLVTPVTLLIVEADGWDPSTLSRLYSYLYRGGCVIWVVDSDQAVSSFTTFTSIIAEYSSGSSVATEGWRWQGLSNRRIKTGRFDNAILNVFEGPGRATLFRQSFTGTMKWDGAGGYEPMLVFDDGSPALAHRWVGAGRLAIFAGDWSPLRSDFAKGPLFVPLLHQLIRGLTPSPQAAGSAHPGEQPVVELLNSIEGEKFVCRDPNGKSVEGSVNPDSQHQLRLAPVFLPGRYTVTSGDDGAVIGGAYVQIDPAESDLRVEAPDLSDVPEAREIIQGRPVLDYDSTDGSLHLRPAGTPLWPYVALLAVVFAAGEPLLIVLTGSSRL